MQNPCIYNGVTLPQRAARRLTRLLCLSLFIYTVVLLLRASEASELINIPKLVQAIYYAEGGSKTSHPYGILAHYKHTTPKQACINTINHALKDWNGKEDFISFLGKRYCPVGASNDPRGLNKNWVKNVRRLYYTK